MNNKVWAWIVAGTIIILGIVLMALVTSSDEKVAKNTISDTASSTVSITSDEKSKYASNLLVGRVASWREYKSDKYGFSFSYPSNWDLLQADETDEGFVFIAKGLDVGPIISVQYFNKDNRIIFRAPNTPIPEVKVGDKNGLISEDTSKRKSVYIMESNVPVMRIAYAYAGIDKAKEQEIFDTILSTFKFADPASVAEDTSNWKTYKSDEYEFEIQYPPSVYIDAFVADSPGEFDINIIGGIPPVNKKTVPTSMTIVVINNFPDCIGHHPKKIIIAGKQYETFDNFIYGYTAEDNAPEYFMQFTREDSGSRCVIATVSARWDNIDKRALLKYEKDVKSFDPNFDPDIETEVGKKILGTLKFTK